MSNNVTMGTVTDLVQNLDEMNCVKSKDSKKYEWAATGCGVRIKLKNKTIDGIALK